MISTLLGPEGTTVFGVSRMVVVSVTFQAWPDFTYRSDFGSGFGVGLWGCGLVVG
jgi:hypothetical protein